MRRHREAFTELYPYKRHHHVAFVELRPGPEAPPRYTRGITSLCWGTTRDSPYEGPWDYVQKMRRHQDLSLRESWNYALPHFIHVPPTNQEFPIASISCKFNKSYNSCFPIHT